MNDTEDRDQIHLEITRVLAAEGLTNPSQPGWSAGYKRLLAERANYVRRDRVEADRKTFAEAEARRGNGHALVVRAAELMESGRVEVRDGEPTHRLIGRALLQADREARRR